jgi:hypothetical protein
VTKHERDIENAEQDYQRALERVIGALEAAIRTASKIEASGLATAQITPLIHDVHTVSTALVGLSQAASRLDAVRASA